MHGLSALRLRNARRRNGEEECETKEVAHRRSVVTASCTAPASTHAFEDRERGLRAIERVEVQARCAARDKPLAEIADHVGGEFADRFDVITERPEPLGEPARNLGAAKIGEAL